MRILIALDGSECSLRALRWGIEVAPRLGAELHSVSIEEIDRHDGAILPMSDEREWRDSLFSETIRRAQDMAQKAGIELRPHVIIGHEVKAIAQFVECGRFDLLVVGFHGHTAYAPNAMGGTCFGLTQHASCPVLVVK